MATGFTTPPRSTKRSAPPPLLSRAKKAKLHSLSYFSPIPFEYSLFAKQLAADAPLRAWAKTCWDMYYLPAKTYARFEPTPFPQHNAADKAYAKDSIQSAFLEVFADRQLTAEERTMAEQVCAEAYDDYAYKYHKYVYDSEMEDETEEEEETEEEDDE